jgi:hypothetical protein
LRILAVLERFEVQWRAYPRYRENCAERTDCCFSPP